MVSMTELQKAKQDEMIIAEILASEHDTGYRLVPGCWEHSVKEDDGSVIIADACALGLGVLLAPGHWRGSVNNRRPVPEYDVQRSEDNFIARFAAVHDVSIEYACGVTDGFESVVEALITNRMGWAWDADEYERGRAVGRALLSCAADPEAE